jgi:hypothetical protein
LLNCGAAVDEKGLQGGRKMKEIGNSLAQLAAIIMLLITLAVSTAAVSQWVSTETTNDKPNASSTTRPLLVSEVK